MFILCEHDPCWRSNTWSRRPAAKINETDTFGPGDDDEIQFDDIGDDDEDIDEVSSRLNRI